MLRVRELFKGREKIPNIREAVFTEKEKKNRKYYKI